MGVNIQKKIDLNGVRAATAKIKIVISNAESKNSLVDSHTMGKENEILL